MTDIKKVAEQSLINTWFYDANTMSGNPDATLGSTNIAKLFVLLLFKKL